jgi:hypothetical protein
MTESIKKERKKSSTMFQSLSDTGEVDGSRLLGEET